MGVLNVIIADDEPLAREAISKYLSEDSRFEIQVECADGKSTLEAVIKNKPDLLFLDIEMPELNGIDVANKLNPNLPFIVFITAFEEYAIKAFEENAIDYLLKPLNKDRFHKMLDKVFQLWENKQLRLDISKIDVLRLLRERPKYLKKITSKHKGVITLIKVDSIFWIESQGAFSKVHLERKTELTNLSIKQLEEVLDPSNFIRVHKSYMVNINHVESLESYFHGEYILKLMNGSQVKLSRGYKENLKRIIAQYE